MKPKLADAGIANTVENKYMTFTTTPTAKTLKIMVSLEDEKKAFEIIDAWLQKSEMFNPKQFHDFKF
ncbi:DUF2007 domain-containing protein [Chryseobacterium sp.]|uniref:DUF2007 domain-containing protein n=1 Tax=Chryseobacterium sp. TaxID=1871047 RepID=UPI001E468C47|nr:DUF2007 domain-containing protein [Chryseobacterium sp.]